MNEWILEAIGLCQSNRARSIGHPLTLKVARGEIFGILGPPESGKTVAFNLLSGKSTPSSGTLLILGKDFWRHERELRCEVGAVAAPQHDINTPGPEESTAREQLEFEAGLIGVPHLKYRDRIDETLAFVQLSSYENLLVAALPGEMKRRLALARALLTKPQLVIIDEPTRGVAEAQCELIWRLLHALQDHGKTIVLTTSSWQEVQEVCDRVAPLSQGKLQDIVAP